jgi:hypothetical protein
MESFLQYSVRTMHRLVSWGACKRTTWKSTSNIRPSLPRAKTMCYFPLSVSRKSFRRCRVASHVLYLSCLASANGQALDPTRGQPGTDYSTSTTYDFPKERPSAEDWVTWRQFWQHYCLLDGSLPRSLGKWRHPAHRVWEWFYDEPSDVVYRREGEVYWLHRPGTGSPGASTRAQQVYSPTEDLVTALPELCLPASVSPDGPGSFTLLPRGPALYAAADSSTASAVEDFWTFLHPWGGEWMWDHCQLPLSLQPVVDCIMAGEAVYVTDGSYNQLQRSDLNGAGWFIYSNRLRRVILRGSMYEVSAEAGSYRGELLGLLAIHTFVLAVSLFYEVSTQRLCPL